MYVLTLSLGIVVSTNCLSLVSLLERRSLISYSTVVRSASIDQE
jgi:hypothetical protein